MEISSFVRAKSLDEAYTLIHERKAFPIGGGAWSRLNARRIDLAVDLSALGLRYIRRNGDQVEIGAMTTARDIETSEELKAVFGSFFADSVAHIVGIQMKNIVTVGGTVAGRYGFAELNTALLAADAEVVLYHEGTVGFEEFLTNRALGPALIEKILVSATGFSGGFSSVRTTATDFPILDVAAVNRKGAWKIAVGARPGSARLAAKAAELLGSESAPGKQKIEEAAGQTAEELSFGNDVRGSGEYRKDVCVSLVRRVIQEAVR